MNKLHSLVLAITLLVGSVSVAIAQSNEASLSNGSVPNTIIQRDWGANEGDIILQYEQDLRDLSRRAELGDGSAAFEYGMNLLNIDKVPEEAKKWFKLAIELDPKGYGGYVGTVMYEIDRNKIDTANYYRRGAEAGGKSGQYLLGTSYVFGDGVIQSKVLAHMWFNIAAANGYEDAEGARLGMAMRMTDEEISKAQQMASECMSSNYQNCGY